MKKVSVVVPCYNAAGYLDRCMKYLLGQTIGIENIEMILVDDASTDEGESYYQSPNGTMRSSWDERKFDNMKVWMILTEDLQQRGF